MSEVTVCPCGRESYYKGSGLCSRCYQQARYGYRPTRPIVCLVCGKSTGAWLPEDLCSRCRRNKRRRADRGSDVPDATCRGCAQPFKRKSGGHEWCHRNPECHPPRRAGGRESAAYKKARKEGDRIQTIVVCRRDKWRCQLCGEKVDRKLKWPDPMSASLDHVRPISKGGSHTFFNVQLAHLACNTRKGKGR